MSLEYTGVPPAPRGMNLAGPSVFIDEAYCRWMQDVLVDRPGQIRMRGPMDYWYSPVSAGISSGSQIIGAAETMIGNTSGIANWRGAVFVANGSSTPTESSSGSGISAKITTAGSMIVYDNINNAPSKVGTITLPFALNTQYDFNAKHWVNNTIIDAKPALGGGVWIGVIDDVTNATSSGVSALFYWRGAGKTDYDASANTATITATTNSNTANLIVHGSSVSSNVEPGMFAFVKNTTDATYNYSYLGIVVNVSGANVTLEKNALIPEQNVTKTGMEILYTSIRGFVHQYGRGYASSDVSGTVLTSGRLGSDAEGLFKAANVTIGGGSSSGHRVRIFRNEDYQFIGTVKYSGSGGKVTNTQVDIQNTSTSAHDILEDEAYVIIRNDDTMYFNTADGYSRRYPIDLNYRRPDMRPGKLTLSSNTKYPSPAPGIYNSTYAGRQWFASFNTTNNTYDKYINRVVFSSPDNGENINLAPDASDSIIIPGQEYIRGIAGSTSGLLVFVASKTYIIRGTDRSNFSLEELYPDGCISAPSIVQVGGGVIWAGKQGIYYFDGVTVRNFTPESLGIYYTDGVKSFDASKHRVYAFVYNNYLIMNFTNWFSNYSLKRYVWSSDEIINNTTYQVLTSTGNLSMITPNCITFSIYLPTGSIGTLSNFTPRGFMTQGGIACMNAASNDTTPPTGNKGTLIDLKNIFTENIDDNTVDGNSSIQIFTGVTKLYSNDSAYSTNDKRSNGPDFYLETKQYNWQEPTLRKWWRKLMFNLRINTGIMMVEFVDINDKSLVETVTGSSPARVSSYDESGFFLIPATSPSWGYYENLEYAPNAGTDNHLHWSNVEAANKAYTVYYAGILKRFSRWIGIRQNSLGFRLYSLRNYNPSNTGEIIPEIIDINDWVWGLKGLRKGRN